MRAWCPARRKTCLRLLFWAAVQVVVAEQAWCLDPNLSLTQYIHTSWTQNGTFAIPEVRAIAETTDGYLWLGTAQGLLRFDGVQVVWWKPPPGNEPATDTITSLTASAGGGLWIGAKRTMSLLRDGKLTQYAIPNVGPGDSITAALEDQRGRLLAGRARGGGLVAIDNGVLQSYGRRSSVYSLFRDRSPGGAIWIGTSGGICRLDGTAFGACRLAEPPYEVWSITGGVDENSLTMGTNKGVLLFADGKVKPIPILVNGEAIAARVVLRDRDGNLWVGTVGQGLFCIRGDRTERFTRNDGLSSDLVDALVEDREGNLWVGTSNGLDLLRDPRVARWSTRQGLSGNLITTVCATREGDVWVAMGAGLNRIRGNRISTYSKASGLPADMVASLYQDPKGTLWAGTARGLVYLSPQGRFVQMQAPGGPPLHRVFSITADAGGTLWLADEQRGVWRMEGGRLQPWALPAKHHAYRLQVNHDGKVWIGYYEGGVAVVDGSAVRTYSPDMGLARGHVQAIYEDGSGSMWVGTDEGLSRFRHGRWTTWTAKEGISPKGVQALTGDGQGNLWLVMASGVARISESDLNRTPDGSPAPLTLTAYGPADGIRLAKAGNTASPRAARSRDGRLWFATDDGLAGIDPSRIHKKSPPRVSIEQLSVDGKPVALIPGEISFRGREVQIDYTALSLTLPETVRFRYELESLDRHWVNADTRRQVVYANLPPGHYRFHVAARYIDGDWTMDGASLAFRCEPFFYQTWLFLALCAVSSGLLVYGGHWLRIQQLRGRFRLVLAERARVTRELHDTLLQGFAGVVYQLEAARRQLTNSPAAGRQRIERALEQADQSLKEAREALSCIRLSALENCSLPEALGTAARQILDGTGIHFDMGVTGRARELPYDVQATLFIVAREAINNALNHAQPKHVSLKLAYSGDRVRLVMQDDGVGFDVEAAGAKSGHWGLVGMRERLRQIGASFSLKSERGCGTRLEVVVELRVSRKAEILSALSRRD